MIFFTWTRETFVKYFKNFTFFSGSTLTHPFNIFHMSNIIFFSFIHAYCSSLILSAGLLAWFACLRTLLLTFYQYPLSYWLSDCTAGCIVHCNKVSKPVKGWGWAEFNAPPDTVYRSFRRRSSQPITWLILTNKAVQENKHAKTKYKSDQLKV